MDSTTYLFDLLKTILPALIVAGAIFLLFRQYLEKEQQRRLIELRLDTSKTTLPLRLQAYERVTLFLERISPNNILVRLGSGGQRRPTTTACCNRKFGLSLSTTYRSNSTSALRLGAR